MGIERVSEGETTEEEAPYEERPIPPDRPGSEGHLSRSESRAAAREANDREPAADEEAHDTPTESVEGNPEQLKTSNLEGRRDYVVVDPADPSRTITDIDHIEDGTLWEEKSATSAVNIDKWVAKHIDKKFGSYLEARRNLTGYEEAPIGFKFTEPNADPEFVSAVEEAVGGLRKSHPDVRSGWSGHSELRFRRRRRDGMEPVPADRSPLRRPDQIPRRAHQSPYRSERRCQ